MVKIDIEEREAKAIIDLMTDAKVPVEMGYILTTVKFKLFKAFKKEGEKKNKESAKKLLSDEYDIVEEVKKKKKK